MTTITSTAVANVKDLPLADESIDMIFTDPPYLGIYLNTYAWLANEAIRVLKPGGFLFAYAGGYYLNRIFRFFDDSGLKYFWEFAEHYPSSLVSFIKQKLVLAKHKNILAYYKGPGPARPRVGGVHSLFLPQGNMKAFHHWGQSVATARYYIDHFTKKNDVVLDPFIGGGSTAVACALIGRECVGFDIDLTAVETTNQRLAHPDHAPISNLPLFAGEFAP